MEDTRPPEPLTFLVVEDRKDNRPLLVRTLLRKFAGSACVECEDSEAAVAFLQRFNPAAAVVHRAVDADGVPVVEMLRQAKPDLPIVMVSGIDRRDPALRAGATEFLLYDEWLKLGTIVAEAIRKQAEVP